MKTKRHSWAEAAIGTGIAFIISYLAAPIIFWINGVESSMTQNFGITICYTLLSFFRSYVVIRASERFRRK